MAVNFDEAVKLVLINEGGLTDNPNDKGGSTNYGISQKVLQEAIAKDIVPPDTTTRSLTKLQAVDIYKSFFWDFLRLDRVNIQSIANKILDVSVNVGVHWGVVLLQRALHAATEHTLDEDGES